jgi:hypothetical protein
MIFWLPADVFKRLFSYVYEHRCISREILCSSNGAPCAQDEANTPG